MAKLSKPERRNGPICPLDQTPSPIGQRNALRKSAGNQFPAQNLSSAVGADPSPKLGFPPSPSPIMASGGRRRDGGGGAFRNQFKRKLVRTAGEELDAKFGFDLFSEGDKRLGWLLTFTSVRFKFSMFFFIL